MDLWDRGLHADLVEDALAEGRDREGCDARCDKEEEECLARSFHIIFLSRNLRQMVRQATDREGGCLLLGDVCIKTGRPVVDIL